MLYTSEFAESDPHSMKFIVSTSHAPESTEFIKAKSGDKLLFERRETKYPGWIWCTDGHGNQAWVPEAYVSIISETCRLVRDYDSRELEVICGEHVRMLEEIAGWSRVVNSEAREGWVPMECLNPVDNASN
jgi:hypothetical protein